MNPDFADLNRRIENLIRTGTVSAVDYDQRRVRVRSGGLESHWLPWLTARAGATRTWSPPDVGEQVVLLCPSGDPAVGIALTGLYSDQFDAPSSSPDEHVTAYPDGARITYNHATGALTVSGIQTYTVEASASARMDTPRWTLTGDGIIDKTLTVVGDVLAKAKATIAGLLTFQGGMDGSGGTGGATARIRGNVEHSGGTLTSNGVSVDSHTHSDPHGGHTGEPNK